MLRSPGNLTLGIWTSRMVDMPTFLIFLLFSLLHLDLPPPPTYGRFNAYSLYSPSSTQTILMFVCFFLL